MRPFTIVGAGQGGLCLAFGLLKDGHRVRLVSNRTADEIEQGPVTSSQSMYDRANAIERELGLNLWDHACPVFDEVGVTVTDGQGNVLVGLRGPMDRPGQAIDQGLKMAGWMRRFQASGGQLAIEEGTVESLERAARESDLVVVATGKGSLSRLFERDPARSAFDRPPHGISLTYVKRNPRSDPDHTMASTLNPGIGKLAVFPGLTTSGPCEILTLLSDAGGPIDVWDDVKTPEQHLEVNQRILDEVFPRESERLGRLELCDPQAVARGRYTPEVRRPVATLPSGAKVLGIGDAVILCDPMGGQGANLAAIHAAVVRDSVRERGDLPFDEAWMVDTSERHWRNAQWGVKYSNMFAGPPSPAVGAFLGLAAGDPGLTRLLANSLEAPESLAPWFFDAALLDQFIASRARGGGAAGPGSS